MSRTGDDEPTCPVLPESIVAKIDEVLEGSDAKGWDYLSERLRVLVSLQRLWGTITELYKLGSSESLYSEDVLPPWIRSPDSTATKYWDSIQLIFICWVAIVVPYRLGFDVEVGLWTTQFFFDAAIDLFFIIDLALNFRTAYYLPTGFLETDARMIRKNYLRTWFIVDFIASLPMTYVGAIAAALSDKSAMENQGSKIIRSTRVIRLTKLLRMARLQRLVGRHGSMVEFTAYVNSLFTFIAILYAAHLVACGWYFVGTVDEQSWIIRNEEQPVYSGSASYKYALSLYTIFKLGEGLCYTSHEAVFAFFSEMVISLIYGALAGVMATIMMAGSVGEQEYLVKLAQLKAWMKARHLSTDERVKIMGYFSATHQSSTYFDEGKILSLLPLGISRDLSNQLYETILAESPLFQGLGPELMLRLCQAVTPVRAIAGQIIYEQGKVGSEMYFVMGGELEVLVDGERLGFLGQGSFFGENAVIETIDRKPGLGAEVRLRTMKASADSDLGMVKAADILKLCDTFPELEIRLQSFLRVGSHLSEKGHNAREIRELKRRVRTKTSGSSPTSTGRSSRGRASPGFINSARGTRSPPREGTQSNPVSRQPSLDSDGLDKRVLSGSDGASSRTEVEEDARAERIASAAASLLPPHSDDPGGPGSDDPRPSRVEFKGLPGPTDIQESASPTGSWGADSPAHEVPASVYLAVAKGDPSAQENQLEAASYLLELCNWECVLSCPGCAPLLLASLAHSRCGVQ